jgi:hypothetical protein
MTEGFFSVVEKVMTDHEGDNEGNLEMEVGLIGALEYSKQYVGPGRGSYGGV